MYTRPASSFIGNYNQITSEQFFAITGKEKPGEIAIRPETFTLSPSHLDNDEEYHFEGIIKGNMPRGNVLRYQINVNGVNIHADVLFDNGDREDAERGGNLWNLISCMEAGAARGRRRSSVTILREEAVLPSIIIPCGPGWKQRNSFKGALGA